ncbi:MAG: hypothetical protein ABI035_07560 [Gemmatimonadaceae bacterium]
MKIDRFVARVGVVAIACAAGTVWFGWLSVACVGFVYGALEWRVTARGSIAALGAVLAWAGTLGAELARGADIRLVAAQIGAVMHVPGALLMVVTLVFGALLAGTAAVLGAGITAAATRFTAPSGAA